MSRDRTVSLAKIVSQEATAEFLVLFAPGPKVEETKFVSGSDLLRSAGQTLNQAHFKIAFPQGSSARLVRRGFLGCYPLTGCTFVLALTEGVIGIE